MKSGAASLREFFYVLFHPTAPPPESERERQAALDLQAAKSRLTEELERRGGIDQLRHKLSTADELMKEAET